ncbi:MAG: hypothetical protein ACLPSW_16370 [Roseiarcus sp.]
MAAGLSQRNNLHFRVIIVTRDSAPWIGIMAEAYARIGLRPLYLVHDKTRDETASILQARGDDVQLISMKHDRGESALSQLPGLVSEDWVLRMDDDEFPSRRMIAFTKATLGRVKEQAIVYARREALPKVSPLSYPRMEVQFNAPLTPFHLDPQLRAFRPRDVEFKDEIHTPGFIPMSMRPAPTSAYMVHFNTIVRPFQSRLTKLARYEKEAPGAGVMAAARLCLPELLSSEELRVRPFETREFDDLARRLAEEGRASAETTLDAELEARILAHFKQPLSARKDELMLASIRDRLDAMPTAVRSFFNLR